MDWVADFYGFRRSDAASCLSELMVCRILVAVIVGVSCLLRHHDILAMTAFISVIPRVCFH